MEDRASKRALEAYPITMSQHSDNCKEYDSNESDRLTFIEGYNQAEKDLELTYDDICEIMEIREDVLEMDSYENLYEEILKRFKEMKETKD